MREIEKKVSTYEALESYTGVWINAIMLEYKSK